MSKILVTGMTASQYSEKYRKKHWTYSSSLISVLQELGHTVEVGFERPDGEYKHIFIGLSSLMSVSSNGVYPTLKTIARYWDSEKITFFIDGPIVGNISDSISSVIKKPDRLFKSLFQKRPGFSTDTAQRDFIMSAVQNLHENPWPTTLVPILPWEYTEDIQKKAPLAQIYRLNLDYAVKNRYLQSSIHKYDFWTGNLPNSSWTTRHMNTMSFGVIGFKQSKHATDLEIAQNISSSVGVLYSPEKDGISYWSPHILSALHLGVPLAVDWKKTSTISHWGLLPGAMEDLRMPERISLAANQKNSYLS